MKNLFRMLLVVTLINHSLIAQETKLVGMGTLNGGTLFAMDLDGSNPELWVDFTSGMNPNFTDLIESNNKLWGMTEAGGRYGLGIIFTLELDGSGFQKVLDFDGGNGANPYGSLFELNGKIWGTTLYGGENNDGVLFNMDPDGTNYQKIHDFEWTTGAHPWDNNLIESNGKLWGMAADGGPAESGVIYSLDLDGSNYTIEYEQGGRGKLYVFGGKIWGAGNLFFTMDPDGTNFNDLSAISSVNFELIAYNDRLWGTQNFQGEHNSGTVFSIGMDGTGYTIIHDFELFANDNGAYPKAGVTVVDGKLWGTTSSGPGFGNGIIYSINPDGSEFTREYEFPGGASGAYDSKSHLLFSNGLLFGLTSEGGRGFGTIFSINPANSDFNRISDFRNENGGTPYGSMIYHDGKLYGMTVAGGTNNGGVIFSIDKDGTNFQKIHEFTGSESPNGSLLVYNGKLWGLGVGGGDNGWGTMFSLNLDGSDYAIAHSFSIFDGRGARPRGSLIEYEGRLFGTTSFDGGSSDARGTIFRTATNGAGLSRIHDFDVSSRGNEPRSDVLPHDGKLWGITSNGGSLGRGVIYSIDPNGDNYTRVQEMGNHSGRGNLITFQDKFWGLNYTSIFSLNTDGTGYTQEAVIIGDNGSNVEGSLIAIADRVWGMAFDGGVNNAGTVFNFSPVEGFTKVIDLSPEFGGNPTGNLLHVKDDQEITFDALSNRTYGDPTFELAASSTSSNPILYTSSDPGIVSIEGTTATIHNAGSVTITAYQAETDFYYEASETQNLQIDPRSITVTADAISKMYGDIDPALTYSITSGNLVAPDVLAGSLDREAGEIAGTYTINQGSLAGGANYTITYVSNDFEITKRSIEVTADDLAKTFGDTDPELTYTVTSGELVSGDSFDGTPARESGENVGDYAILVSSLSPGENYEMEFVEGTFTINPVTISVVPDPQSKVYGDADPALTYTSDPLEGSDTFSGTLERVAGETVGDYEIQIGSLSAGNNYELVVSEAYLTITQRPVSVTADDLVKTFGEADPELTYAITSGNLVGADEFSGSLSREAGEDAGDYAIEENTLTAGANYTITFIEAALTIEPKSIAVSADAQTKVYGDADPTLTYTADALEGSDTFSGALERVAGETVGDYEIQIGSLSAGNNYELVVSEAYLTITQRPVTVTADDLVKTFGETDPELTYAITSGNLVGADEFSGSLSREAGEDAGVYAIEENALTAGANYTITFIEGSFTIEPKSIAVSADAQTKVYGDADPTLTYTADALEGPDTFSGTLERVTGETVGDYEIQIGSLSAGSNYELLFTSDNLSVTPRLVSIRADDLTKVFNDPDPTLTYSITSGSLIGMDEFSGSLSREAGEDAGTYSILGNTLTLGENYELDFLGGTLAIEPMEINVTSHPQTKVYGETDPVFTYSADPLVGSDVFSGSLERASGEDVGDYEIQIGSLSAGGNYELIFASENLTITVRPLTVAAENESKVYGSSDPDLLYSITSGSLAASDQFVGSLEREEGENAGTYVVEIGSLEISENYSLTFVSAEFEISKAPLTATAEDKSFAKGEEVPELTVTYEGFVNNEDEQVLDELPVLSTTATSESDAGDYVIEIAEIVDNNYQITTISGTISVFAVLSVDEATFHIYPNPASTRLFVDSNENTERMILYDIKGIVVAEYDLTSQKSVDVSQLPKGLYVVYLESEGSLKSAGKLVLK